MWEARFHARFEPEFDVLPASVQDGFFAQAKLLEHFGPQVGRPRVDT